MKQQFLTYGLLLPFKSKVMPFLHDRSHSSSHSRSFSTFLSHNLSVRVPSLIFSCLRIKNHMACGASSNRSNFSIAHHQHNVIDPNIQLFFSPIPSTYILSKGKPLQLYFTIFQLNSTDFTWKVCKYVPVDFVYTVYIKVRYNVDEFAMSGNQFGFVYSYESDVKGLFSTVSARLIQTMIDYNLTEDDIVYIQVTFRQKDKKLLSEFSLDNLSLIPKPEFSLVETNLSIPVSINEDYLGKPLPVDILNGVITFIHISIDGKVVNFLDIIKNNAKVLRANHKDNITCFDEKFKFYLLKDKYDYVLAVKILGADTVDKLRYSINGVVLSHVIDIAAGNVVLRNTGEKQLVIRDSKVVSITQDIKLKPLDKPKHQPLFVEDNNIGVIDIETYESRNGSIRVYALGFKTNLIDKIKVKVKVKVKAIENGTETEK